MKIHKMHKNTNLIFRIEAIKLSDGTASRDFKTLKTPVEVLSQIRKFSEGNSTLQQNYHRHLLTLKETLESSEFFRGHEVCFERIAWYIELPVRVLLL